MRHIVQNLINAINYENINYFPENSGMEDFGEQYFP